jgi:hypothetical protein
MVYELVMEDFERETSSAGLVTSLGKLRECIQQHELLCTRQVRRDIKRRTDTKREQCRGGGVQKEGQLPITSSDTRDASLWTRPVAQAYAQVVKEISPVHSLIGSIRSLLLLSSHMPVYEEGEGQGDGQQSLVGDDSSTPPSNPVEGHGAFVRMWSL